MKTREIIENAAKQVKIAVSQSKADSKTVIARYAAAVTGNFQLWMGITGFWARHEIAQHALKDNMRCEAVNNHMKMLRDFAKFSSASPSTQDFASVQAEVEAIEEMFANTGNAGLFGVMLMAILEKTSDIFIPDLERRAIELGCKDLTYPRVHGAADSPHAEAFERAADTERSEGYENPELIMQAAAEKAVALIKKPWS